MASNGKATVLQAQSPEYFFKVIIPSSLEAKKVKIPETFALIYGSALGDVAKLKMPNGRTWHIGLTRAGRTIWLQDGWDEFVQYYSISAGYFVVFKYARNSKFYARNSKFHVVILDETSCEIDYPAIHNLSSEEDEMETESEDSVEIIECSNIGSPIILDTSSEGEGEDDDEEDEEDEGDEEEEMEGGEEEEVREASPPRKRTISALDKDRVLTAARAFKSSHPHCAIMLQPSYVKRKACMMYFPIKFTKKYLTGVSGFVQLRNSDGRQWSVRCTNKDGSAKLTEGWYKFAMDNNLEEGDVCVFELHLMKEDCLFDVTVFPVHKFHKGGPSSHNRKDKRPKIDERAMVDEHTDESDHVKGKRKAQSSASRIEKPEIAKNLDLIIALQSQGIMVGKSFRTISREEREKALIAASSFKSMNPAFMLILRPSNLASKNVYIPEDFGLKHFQDQNYEFIKLQDSQERESSLHIVRHHGLCIKRMSQCFKDNYVGVGDIMIFELIKGKKPLLKVSIFYASDF